MNIRGKYRDVLSKNGESVLDFGWKSNAIVEDFGRFLAALMKKDFNGLVGIDYIAVGSGSDNNPNVLKNKLVEFFDGFDRPPSDPLVKDEYWVWAKEIDPNHIQYIDSIGSEEVTNKLKINVAPLGTQKFYSCK